jgi:hypothetical protein
MALFAHLDDSTRRSSLQIVTLRNEKRHHLKTLLSRSFSPQAADNLLHPFPQMIPHDSQAGLSVCVLKPVLLTTGHSSPTS